MAKGLRDEAQFKRFFKVIRVVLQEDRLSRYKKDRGSRVNRREWKTKTNESDKKMGEMFG